MVVHGRICGMGLGGVLIETGGAIALVGGVVAALGLGVTKSAALSRSSAA